MAQSSLAARFLAVPRTRSARVERALAAAAVGLSLVYVGGFLAAAYFRVTFAYPMGGAESESMQAVRRIISGRPLYGSPTLDFVAPVYAPLYFYLSAGLATLIGASLPTLRLLSLLASIGSAAIVGALVWRETRASVAALGAAALFVASTHLAANALDLARTDALSVFWLLAAALAARAADNSPRAVRLSVLSGCFAALAVLTKQTTLLVALALAAHAILSRQPRRAAAYLCGLIAILASAALVLVAAFGAWPWFYLLQLPGGHAFDLRYLATFWSTDILPWFGLPVVVGVAFLVVCARRHEWARLRFWVILPCGMLALAWISRVDDGGALNVLVPAFAPLACWFGLGVGEAQQGDARYRAGALALLAVALVVVRYNPRDGSPLRSDVWAGERLVATIGQLPGSVYSPVYAEYAYQAGKGDAAYATNVMELMGSFGGGVRPYGEDWMAQYTEALRERRFDQLLLDPEYAGFLVQGAQDSGYVDTGQLFPVDDVITQWQSPFIQMPHRWVPRERLTP